MRTISLSTTQNALALARTQLAAIADREHGVPSALTQLRVRADIIGHARIKYVCKSQSCMVSKVPIVWKQTVHLH